MTITVDISPEVEAELARNAAAQGVDVRAYVATLLQQLAQTEAVPGRKSLARLFAESPFAGLDVDFERDPYTGRDFECTSTG